MVQNNIDPQRFLVQWVSQHLGLWLVGAVFCLSTWLIALAIATVIASFISLPTVVVMGGSLLLAVWLGFLIGHATGDTQQRLLHEELDWQPTAWQRESMIGGALGGALLWVIFFMVGRDPQLRLALLLLMPAYALCLSGWQWRAMRRTARDAWLWILGNVAAGMVFSGLLLQNSPQDGHLLLSLLLWAGAVIAQSLITGLIILWLYDRPIHSDGWPEDSEREYARVTVEVYTDHPHGR